MKNPKVVDSRLITTFFTTLPVVSTTGVLAETSNVRNQELANKPILPELNNSIYQDKSIDLEAAKSNSQPDEADVKDRVELGIEEKINLQTVKQIGEKSVNQLQADVSRSKVEFVAPAKDKSKGKSRNTNTNINREATTTDKIINNNLPEAFPPETSISELSKSSQKKPVQEKSAQEKPKESILKNQLPTKSDKYKLENQIKTAINKPQISYQKTNHPQTNQNTSNLSNSSNHNELEAQEINIVERSVPATIDEPKEKPTQKTEEQKKTDLTALQSINSESIQRSEEDNSRENTNRKKTEITETIKTTNSPNIGKPLNTLEIANQELRIITPLNGETTAKTTNLAIQYASNQKITVTINGKPLDGKLTSHIQTDDSQQVNTQIWYNLPLIVGENTIAVTADTGKTTSVIITRKKQQVKIAIAPAEEAKIPADGRSMIKISGKITNENNEIIREDVSVTLTTTAGKFTGVDNDADAPGFQVQARNGEFNAELQASLEAQQVKVRAAIDNWPQQDQANLEAYTHVEFITNLRPSLATGSINLRIGAGGTDYHGRFRDFLNPSKTGRTDVDVDAAVFATGKIGDWLFTGAYNSDRPLNEDCNGENRLFGGVQDCEKAYPVYGDASNVIATTPSTDSLYAKFERTPNIPGAESDYFMWGDYNTQEFNRSSQLFSASDRQLHGFKGNYNLGNLQITALFANNIEGFQRDNIAPNGTSGFYFLSRRDVVPGTENVYIESEEINRPGTVVKRKNLSRGADYEIDYQRGTIMLRSRVFSTELNPFGSTLTNRIIITYQNDTGSGSKLYGGRVQYNFRGSNQGNNSEVANNSNSPFIAASYLWEDQNAQYFELIGADAFIPLGKNGQIIAEYAHSRHNSLAFGYVDGSAYRLEASGNLSPNLQANAFYRSVTENFANNATFSFVPGQTRYGASLAGKLSSTTSFNLGYDHEDNFGIAPALRTNTFDLFNPQPQPIPGSKVDNSLTTFRAGIGQKIGNADIGVEYINRQRQDRIDNRFDANTSQIVSKASIPLTESLTFRAQNELNLGQKDALYPNRTTLGLDWGLYPGITMRLAHQFFEGGVLRGNSLTSLDTLVEHKFSEDTSVTGRYSIFSGIDGMNDQAAVGLNHRIRLAPGLKLNLGYERIQNNIFGNTAAGIRFAQPYTTGQSGFTLGSLAGNSYSIGLDYTDNPNFQANARFEYRDGEEGNNMVISAAAAGKLSPALTAAVRYQQAGGANQLLGNLADTAHLRLGLAYRDPSNDKFNALLGYEYRLNPSTSPDTLLAGNGGGTTEHLFSAEAIYAPNWQWEFYGKYAFRNNTSYLAENFTNTSTAHLAQLRTTYQLGYRTDLALEGRWLGQPSEGFNEFGLALEGGYYLTPDLRVGVGYAFGSADDRDFTGFRSAGGPYLNISYKINELFAGFGRQKPAPKQQQESVAGERRSGEEGEWRSGGAEERGRGGVEERRGGGAEERRRGGK